MNNFILDGIAYTFGVFLNDYVEFFNSSTAATSLASALLCGVYLLVGKNFFHSSYNSEHHAIIV